MSYCSPKLSSRGEKGLTLVEILVVIVILGIISVIAVPMLSQSVTNAKTSTSQEELKSVKTAVGVAMTNDQVSTIAGADSIPLSASSTVNFTNASNTVTGTTLNIGQFFSAGATSVKGTYAIGTDGSVFQVTIGQ
jgi:prepilin-type N-terminal cleavage/methylation domain-containing protein